MTTPVVNASMARGTYLITPDDDNDLPFKAHGIYIGGAGTLHYLGDDGEEDTVTLSAGERWPVIIKRVYEDSTATDLHAFRLSFQP